MTKQHFIWFANYIRTAPLSDADKQKLATMAIAAGAHFNGKFSAERFLDDRDPLDEQDRDGGPLEDTNDEAMKRWAERYDDLNGAPENDDDR